MFYVSDPFSTPPEQFSSQLQQLVYETFAAKGIPFERVDTDPGITMEDCLHIGARIGVPVVKTLFLCNRQQTEFYLYVTSDDKPFVTRDFCQALGIPRVSFASAEKLWELTGVKVGATTILSAVLPAASAVHLVMDAAIAGSDYFACTDGTATCFVKLRTQDLLHKYLEGKSLAILPGQEPIVPEGCERHPLAPKKLILFDLDGTLIDTLEDLGAAVDAALERRGLPLHSLAEYRKMVGHGVRNLVKQALPAALQEDASALDAALADFKAYYQAHIDVHTRPYPGMPELLRALQDKGVKLAVTSNKFQEGTEYLIREFFPDIAFVAVLGNRPGYPLKPSPEIVEEVLAKAGIDREDALLVGDSPTDMRTAANGGIDAIAVGWGYRTAEELGGNRIVLTPAELQRLLLYP